MTEAPGYDELRAARDELDQVIREIQRVPGYESFLAEPTFDEILAVSDPDPVVYLAATELGGLALIVRDGRADPIELPEMRTAALGERVEAYLQRYEASRLAGHREHDLREAWSDQLDEVTHWLWQVAAGELVAAVGDAGQVTLIPCGLLGLLPLHAAWTDDAATPTGRRYLTDQMVIAYAPSARALTACRRGAAQPADRLLVVADPAPSTRPALPATRLEAAVAAAFAPGATVLDGSKATLEAVTRQLAGAQVAHFGCHGKAELAEPLNSGLLLGGDAELLLRQILQLRLTLRLAVLSACETSMIGTDLPDEVVGLPAGLVQAGAAGVVASMWATREYASVLLMIEFYRQLRGSPPAVALAVAQRWLRDATRDEVESLLLADEPRDWLPEQVSTELAAELFTIDPGPSGRPWSRPVSWAAFAFTGA